MRSCCHATVAIGLWPGIWFNHCTIDRARVPTMSRHVHTELASFKYEGFKALTTLTYIELEHIRMRIIMHVQHNYMYMYHPEWYHDDVFGWQLSIDLVVRGAPRGTTDCGHKFRVFFMSSIIYTTVLAINFIGSTASKVLPDLSCLATAFSLLSTQKAV